MEEPENVRDIISNAQKLINKVYVQRDIMEAIQEGNEEYVDERDIETNETSESTF